MRTWIITALVVLIIAGLAITAGWWMPELLARVIDDAALVQLLTNLTRVVLWLLAALAGAVGAHRALDRTEAAKPASAGSQEDVAKAAVAGNGNGQETGLDEDLIEVVTSGGVRIITEGSCLELEEGEPWDQYLATLLEEESDLDEAGLGSIASIAGAPPVPVITTPFNLPADLTDFTGRMEEVATLHQRLSQLSAGEGGRGAVQRSRTITISSIAAMGGMGKTSLALHVAHEAAAEGLFPDAQLYIDLKGTEANPMAPAAALKTLLTALLGPDPERPEDEQGLAEMWRAALQDREALIILDNAASAEQVHPLLPGSPTCAVLITSRRRFTLPGADLMDLNRLKPEESRSLLIRLAPRLTGEEADEIADLCGGLPLALRIAGNYLAMNEKTPAGDYAAGLADERERLFHLRDPDDPDLDVAATLSLSVAQLDAGAQWAWRLLALFPAPFSAPAAAALWGDGVARDAWEPFDKDTSARWLRTLHNRSLVSYDQEADRYQLHDLVQLAASQELGGEEVNEARTRLVFYYLELIKQVSEQQRFPDLDPEWPHLQMALEQSRQDVDLFSELVLCLNDYWSVRGMARERADWSQRAAKACATARRRSDRGAHLTNLGRAYADRGQARRAIEYYGRALPLSRGNGDRRIESTLLGHLGQAYAALGEARRSILYHRQALDIAQTMGDRRSEGIHLGNMGRAYVEVGEPKKAVEHLVEALAIAQELGDQRMEGSLLGNLGLAYADMGEVQQALDCQKQALSIHRKIGHRPGEAEALENLGRAYAEIGQPQRAVDYYEQALEIVQSIGDRRAEGADLRYLGQAYLDMGAPERAAGYCEESLKIAHEIGDRRNEGASLGQLGRAHMAQGDVKRAMSAFQQALNIARQVGDRRGEAAWLSNLGQAYASTGQLDKAWDHHKQALSIYREIGDRRGEGDSLASLGLLAREGGDQHRARAAWTDALHSFEAIKDPRAGRVYGWLADLEPQS